jgi:hypothetical protein
MGPKRRSPRHRQVSRASGIAPVDTARKAAGRSVLRILPASRPGCQHRSRRWTSTWSTQVPGWRHVANPTQRGSPEIGPERRKPRPGGGWVARTHERGSCRPSGPPAGPCSDRPTDGVSQAGSCSKVAIGGLGRGLPASLPPSLQRLPDYCGFLQSFSIEEEGEAVGWATRRVVHAFKARGEGFPPLPGPPGRRGRGGSPDTCSASRRGGE